MCERERESSYTYTHKHTHTNTHTHTHTYTHTGQPGLVGVGVDGMLERFAGGGDADGAAAVSGVIVGGDAGIIGDPTVAPQTTPHFRHAGILVRWR